MSQNEPTLSAMIHGILSMQAYDRGHSAGQYEVALLQQGLEAEFAGVFDRITRLEDKLVSLAEHVRNGDCNPPLADEAMQLLGNARRVNVMKMGEAGLLWAASRALSFMMEQDGDGFRVVGQHGKVWDEPRSLQDAESAILADLARLRADGTIEVLVEGDTAASNVVMLHHSNAVGVGDTLAQALMRGIVSSELGDIVEVPVSLLPAPQKPAHKPG